MASKLFNRITKLDEEIEQERKNQTRARSLLNKLTNERPKHQSAVNDKNKTSDEQDQARADLKKCDDELKQTDAEFKTFTANLSQLIQEKENAVATLRQELETGTDKDDLAGQLDELKGMFSQMALGDGGSAQTTSTDQGTPREVLQELVSLLKADNKTGPGPSSSTTPNRTKSLANLPSLTKASGYNEHLNKIKTFFRLNEVTTEQNKKDLLILSLAPEVAVRAQGVDSQADPYSTMDFDEFAKVVGERMVPKASASILRSQFDSTKQKPGEYCVDYLVKKHAIFIKAYPGGSMPVSFLARHLVEGIFSEELKSEMWRKISEEEEHDEETDLESITRAFTSIIQKANVALDFVRKSAGIAEDTDKRGLGVVSIPDPGTGVPASGSKDKTLYLGQVEEQYGEEMAVSWEAGEEGGEEVYNVEDEVDEETPLSEEAVNYCELVEPPEQTKFWNLPEELGEAREGGKPGGGRGACWVCGSLSHYKQFCPQRLKAVNNRVNAMLNGGRGGSQARRPTGRWRGGRGGTRFPSTPYSAYAPFGRGAHGRPQFYPPGSRPTWFPSSPGPRPARGFGRGTSGARNPFQ